MKPERQLRIFQGVCLFLALVVLLCLPLQSVQTGTRQFSVGNVLLAIFAVYMAWMGFFVQRLFNRLGKHGRRVTPTKAWMWGHVTRLAIALSVCMYAVLLHIDGAASWLVYCIFGLGVILLLIWRPGIAPVPMGS
jgi:hypothetical protein